MMPTSAAGDFSKPINDREAGYTLLEMLVVLTIIALTAGLVGVHWSGRKNSGNVELEASRIEVALRLARSEALTGGKSVPFDVNVTNRTWQYAHHPPNAAASGVRLSIYTGRALVAKDEGTIVFFPNGQSSGGHITVSTLGRVKQIDVDWLTGRIHQDESNE
jgi:general secretion pathway protein H